MRTTTFTADKTFNLGSVKLNNAKHIGNN